MRVTPDGDSINSLTISSASGVQSSPDISYGGGNYLVVWTDSRKTGSSIIYGARVTPAGQVLETNGIQIGPTDKTYQNYPAVSFNGTQFLTAWVSSSAIVGRYVDVSGKPLDTVRIAQAENNVYALRSASDGSNFLITWLDFGKTFTVKGQIMSRKGESLAASFVIADSVQSGSIGLCFDGTNYVVTWSNGQAWGRKVSRDGKAIGSAFRISNSVETLSYCDVAAGPNSRYFNVWVEKSDIYGNLNLPVPKRK